ncbi:AAC(3) family N-acetyltransferase [Litorilituus lipolyticus]|uniref:Aminoglycoside N(3)-acetyltransferase n=1 Tax=Litorilituus lipolyticus TaxID=2491017 RepID=A0A502KZS0_9GAMM|nr:AAC(3) family N-acetyltransferase [Litorilituus lipolyticus]TPH17148.1 AAC(3) family N-acetyltransferase [Litorilituus lipolyticus]
MKLIEKSDIETAYHQLGLSSEEFVVLHSSLLKTGIINKEPVANLPASFFSALTNVIGAKGNVFMPAFDYSFPASREVDLRSQPTCVGVWPEWFRKQADVVRSAHPMFSYCGYGPKAVDICQPEVAEFDSFAKNSTMARLIENDAMLVLQGTHIGVATVVVQCEAMLDVKYRFLKPFHGDLVLTNGQRVTGNYYHFCFPFNNEYRENYSLLEQRLLSSNKMTKVSLGAGVIYAVKLKELFTEVKTLITENPFALLAHTPQNYYHFENGQEIATPLS